MFAAPTTISNYFKVLQIDNSSLRSDPPYIGGVSVPDRLYGGLALSQAVNALLELNSHLVPHTVNYKFIAPGSTRIPLQFKVGQFDDGKITSVDILQKGKLIGRAHIRSSNDPDHLDPSSFLCPDYDSPDSYPRVEELAAIGQADTFVYMQELGYFPMEVRPIETPLFPLGEANRHSTWLRMKPQFHESLKPTDGLFIVLFLSDFTMLQVASEMYEKSRVKLKTITSLHHSVWIHESNINPFAWYIIIVECHIISFSRARLESRIFNESRKCVMTVIQEGYFLKAVEEASKL